jgi:hypothetical protein
MNHIKPFANGRSTLILIFLLVLFSCKSATDIKYNEMYSKFFNLRMGSRSAVSVLNNLLEKQMDITKGRKFIHKDDENLSPSDLDKLNAGITYVQFVPTEKEISDANVLINKINGFKPLLSKTDSICKHAIGFYEGGQIVNRPPSQIVKHPSYDVMDKDLQEINKVDKQIRENLGMSLVDFLIQNDKEFRLDVAKDSAFVFRFFPFLR